MSRVRAPDGVPKKKPVFSRLFSFSPCLCPEHSDFSAFARYHELIQVGYWSSWSRYLCGVVNVSHGRFYLSVDIVCFMPFNGSSVIRLFWRWAAVMYEMWWNRTRSWWIWIFCICYLSSLQRRRLFACRWLLAVDVCSCLIRLTLYAAFWHFTSLMHCLASSSNNCPLNADFFFSTWKHPRLPRSSLFEIFCILFISRMIFVPFIFPFSQWRLCWFCLVFICYKCSIHYLILDYIISIRIYNITMHLRLLFCRTKFTYELINLSNFPDAPAFSQIQPKLTFSASIIKRQSDHK